ncbi:MAG: helix-turn-helix domain-containing protein [Clostridia bacterium]|nr:helix-turn-helix domain-containing protein [Clostridia bacterium]
MEFGKRLTELRRAAGFSQQEVAKLLSKHTVPITNRAVSKWETGASYPDAAQFIWLCEIYGVTDVVSEFLGIGGDSPYSGLNREGVRMASEFISLLRLSDRYSERLPAPPAKVIRTVPLYDLPVSAGTGIFLDSDNYESYESDSIPPEANFAVRISGDSMEPMFSDGQIVFVRSTTELASGDIGIFIYNGDSYCKKLDKSDGLRLMSLNPRYKPISIKYAYELRVVGKVVG